MCGISRPAAPPPITLDVVAWAAGVLGIALSALLGLLFALLSTGRLTLDTGWGRRMRPLGPQVVRIQAPREMVFDLAGVPYLARNPPQALREKVAVLERGDDVVIAAHRTRVGPFTTVTVESVSFARPERIAFRLLRGPVPFVAERFLLREIDGGAATELEYSGELGTDHWGVGAGWGALVARYWERTVANALESLKVSAERMAARSASVASGRASNEP
jgi:hypothetical protein